MTQEFEPSLDDVAASRTASAILEPFPRFTPVARIPAADYACAIAGHLPYSSFNYVSLRCYWPEAQAARFGDGVALILTDPTTATPFLTLLGRKGTDFCAVHRGGGYYQP